MDFTFISKTMITIRRVLSKKNTWVPSLLIFYENRKDVIFKVLSSVVYCIIKNHVCDDDLCFPQTKLHVENKLFENSTYNDISGIL